MVEAVVVVAAAVVAVAALNPPEAAVALAVDVAAVADVVAEVDEGVPEEAAPRSS